MRERVRMTDTTPLVDKSSPGALPFFAPASCGPYSRGFVQPINCPQCGAPANVQPGQALYECPYCKRTFQTAQMFGPPAPMANPMPPPPQVQQIVIIAPGAHYPDDSTPFVPAPRGSSFAGWGVMIFILVLVLGVAGGVRFLSASGSGSSLLSGLVWNGKETLVCGGNDQITISGVNANVSGTAIEAGGNCHVKIVDSTIKAGTVVDAAGNADVTFQGGSIEGTTAVDASGNAHVRFNGTKVTGSKKKSGNAKVD